MRLESTVLSDLSANVFAALLLILLILMQAPTGADPRDPSADPRPVEATTDLRSRSRAPMRAGDLVALFHGRRPTADGVSLDLTPTGLAVVRDGRTIPVDAAPAAFGAILRDLDPRDSIRLYVFSQERYDALAQALSDAGLRWREISVPSALRDRSGGRWSQGFLTLLDRGLDRDGFRSELARLLAASPDPLSPDGRVAGAGTGGGGAAASAVEESRLARFARWLMIGVGIAAVIAGLSVVVAVETLVPRSAARYSDFWRETAGRPDPPEQRT